MGCPGAYARQGLQGAQGGRDVLPGAQTQLAAVHGLRQGLDGALALAHDAQAAHQGGVFVTGQGDSAREMPIQLRPGCDAGLAQSLHQTVAQGARGLDGDLLPQHRAHGQFKAVQTARDADALGLRKVRAKYGGHSARVCVQVQPVPDTGHQFGQHRQQAGAGLQMHLRRMCSPRQNDPTTEWCAQGCFWEIPAHGSVQLRLHSLTRPVFHTRQRAVLQELPEVLAQQGRSVGQGERHRRVTVARQWPQLARCQTVVLGKARVHATGRAEAAQVRNLGRGQGAVVQPLFGQQQPLGLQVLHGRDLPVLFKHPAQVPIADAQTGSQCAHGWGFAAFRQRAAEQPGSRLGQDGAGVGA